MTQETDPFWKEVEPGLYVRRKAETGPVRVSEEFLAEIKRISGSPTLSNLVRERQSEPEVELQPRPEARTTLFQRIRKALSSFH